MSQYTFQPSKVTDAKPGILIIDHQFKVDCILKVASYDSNPDKIFIYYGSRPQLSVMYTPDSILKIIEPDVLESCLDIEILELTPY